MAMLMSACPALMEPNPGDDRSNSDEDNAIPFESVSLKGAFVSLGGPSLDSYYSSDGINWHKAVLPHYIASIGGKLFAIDFDGSMYCSANGSDWQKAVLPSGVTHIQDIVYGGGIFVGKIYFGVWPINDASYYYTRGMCYSTDGITWDRVTLPPEIDSYWSIRRIVYDGGKFVGIGLPKDRNRKIDGGLFYSTNGSTWQKATTPSGLFVDHPDMGFDIICNGGIFITTTDNRPLYSTNGISWQIATLPSGVNYIFSASFYYDFFTYNPLNYSYNFKGVVYVGEKFFVGTNGASLCYSTDGSTWSKVNLPIDIITERLRIFYANGKYVCSGGLDMVVPCYSTDGITWTEAALPSGADSINVIYCGGGKFFGSVPNGGIYYSTDGITWNKTTLPVSYIKNIVYGNGKFVVTGYDENDLYLGSYYSTDGITWQKTPGATLLYGDIEFFQ